MFKNVFVLKKLHVIVPNPLKKKNVNIRYQEAFVLLHFTSIFIRQKKKICSKRNNPPRPKYMHLKFILIFDRYVEHGSTINY